MKRFYAIALALLSLSAFIPAFAQTSNPSAPSDSPCRVIEIHCQCENPHKDFVIPRQKVGKVNSTDRGACWSSKNITGLLTNLPMTYCMKDGSFEKDPTKPQTKCSATWTCKEPCPASELELSN